MNEVNYSAWIAQLEDHDWKTRQQARLELMRAGEKAIPVLARAILSGDAALRFQAAKALSQMDTPAVIPILIETLVRNPYFGVRWIAAEGLIRLRESGLAPLLRSLRQHSDSTWLREGAHHILRSLHDEGVESEAIDKVLHALEDVEPALEVPWAAEAALEHLSQKKGQP